MIKNALFPVLAGLIGAGAGLLAARLVLFPSNPPGRPPDFADSQLAAAASTCTDVATLTSQRSQLERKLDEVTHQACPAPTVLRRRLGELQSATSSAQTRIAFHEGLTPPAPHSEPIPWPEELADRFKEAASREATKALAAELGLMEAQVVVDCTEYPCVASAIVDHATPAEMSRLNATFSKLKTGAPFDAKAFTPYADDGGIAVFLRAHGANHDGKGFGEFQVIVSAVFRPANIPAPFDELHRITTRLNSAEELPRPEQERK